MTPKQNPIEYHRRKVAEKTIKMHPIMVAVMGGMTIEEARQILRRKA